MSTLTDSAIDVVPGAVTDSVNEPMTTPVTTPVDATADLDRLGDEIAELRYTSTRRPRACSISSASSIRVGAGATAFGRAPTG
jgi:hypothetical protein